VANLEQLEILKQGVPAWHIWRNKNPQINLDLSEADLSGMKLTKAYLRGADLHGSSLVGANLCEAILTDVNLRWAKVHSAKLNQARLQRADLRYADFSQAFLLGADLRGANLIGANFSNAILTRAIFDEMDIRRARFEDNVTNKEKDQGELKKKEEEASELFTALQKALDEHVKQVRLSNRLGASPACLVGAQMDYSPQMERLLQKGKGGGPRHRRILELNPNHEIFVKLQERFQQNKEDEAIGKYAELLLGHALLAEGSEIPEPAKFNRLVVELMLRTL
jgi:hypothetical protein